MISLGRAGAGIEFSLQSRYYTYLAPLYFTLSWFLINQYQNEKRVFYWLAIYFVSTMFLNFNRPQQWHDGQYAGWECAKKIVASPKRNYQCRIDGLQIEKDTLLDFHRKMKARNMDTWGL